MNPMLNALLLIAGALLSLGAFAQAGQVPAEERKVEEPSGRERANDAPKEAAWDERPLRGPAVPNQGPQSSVAGGKNKVLFVPPIPVDQLGLGCAE